MTRFHDPQRPAGAWSLAPGQSTCLCPGQCGHLRLRGGGLWLNGRQLDRGEDVRVWSHERVQLRNFARSATGFFSWDYCAQQPGARARARSLLTRWIEWLAAPLQAKVQP